MSIEQRFLEAFAGSAEGHGQTTVTAGRRTRDGKAEAKSFVVRGPLTVDHIAGHLSGQQGIGAIPITRENMAKFGAIDIDQYDLDHAALIIKIRKYRLPVIPCRSKSGGAHLFVFLKDWVEARLLREYLGEMASALGYAKAEIFPKQDSILIEKGDVGNFINLPYFDAENTMRYAFNEAGESITVEEFLDAVEASRVDLSAMEFLTYVDEDTPQEDTPERGWLKEVPPCIRNKLREGAIGSERNHWAFQYSVFAKKKDIDNWKPMVEEFNAREFSPPLTSQELSGTVLKSHEKKDYGYKCNEPSIAAYCDKKACRKLKHGIGSRTADMPNIGGLTILLSDPKLLFLDVDGKRLEITMKQLQHQTLFQEACMEQLLFAPQKLKDPDWVAMVNELLRNATQVPVPEELTTKGQFLDLLKTYCTSRIRAKDPEELAMGKPWTDELQGRTMFTMNGLFEFLKQRNFALLTKPQVQQILKGLNEGNDCDGHKSIKKVDGSWTTIRIWWVPQFVSEEVSMPAKEVSSDVPF
jgi:hypothetical protein